MSNNPLGNESSVFSLLALRIHGRSFALEGTALIFASSFSYFCDSTIWTWPFTGNIRAAQFVTTLKKWSYLIIGWWLLLLSQSTNRFISCDVVFGVLTRLVPKNYCEQTWQGSPMSTNASLIRFQLVELNANLTFSSNTTQPTEFRVFFLPDSPPRRTEINTDAPTGYCNVWRCIQQISKWFIESEKQYLL